MDNLKIYNAAKSVPKDAQKPIAGGRLKGKTDINPMWRIHKLTELFGICGIGWKTDIKRFWTESGNGGEVAAFCEIALYIKVNGEWSDGIAGIGGSSFVAKEGGGLYTSDECFKMAYTDAISVACKALGFGADIYWQTSGTKYDTKPQKAPQAQTPPPRQQAPKQDIIPPAENAIEQELAYAGSMMVNNKGTQKRLDQLSEQDLLWWTSCTNQTKAKAAQILYNNLFGQADLGGGKDMKQVGEDALPF